MAETNAQLKDKIKKLEEQLAAAGTPVTDDQTRALLAEKDREIATLKADCEDRVSQKTAEIDGLKSKLADETARADANGETLAKRIEEYNTVAAELRPLSTDVTHIAAILAGSLLASPRYTDALDEDKPRQREYFLARCFNLAAAIANHKH